MALDRVPWQGSILLSFAALADLYEVLNRPHFQRYIDHEDIRFFFAALTQEAEWIDVDVEISACRILRMTHFSRLP